MRLIGSPWCGIPALSEPIKRVTMGSVVASRDPVCDRATCMAWGPEVWLSGCLAVGYTQMWTTDRARTHPEEAMAYGTTVRPIQPERGHDGLGSATACRMAGRSPRGDGYGTGTWKTDIRR